MHYSQYCCPESNQGVYYADRYWAQRNDGSRVQVQVALWLRRRQEEAGLFFSKDSVVTVSTRDPETLTLGTKSGKRARLLVTVVTCGLKYDTWFCGDVDGSRVTLLPAVVWVMVQIKNASICNRK